jgi:acyl-CoA thioester hydrolase
MTGEMLKKFKHPLQVTVADIDALGHVNNVVYLRWVQDAAEAHWASLTTPAQRSVLAWVVIRHEIDYYQAAKLTDELFAETWVGETAGVKSIRFVDIKNNQGILFAQARTTWCLIDPVSQKPKRISAEVREIFKNYIH